MRANLYAAEPYRLTDGGVYATKRGTPYGAFYVPFRTVELKVIVDDGDLSGWEHVSVSLTNRCPNWDELCFIKSLFWDDEESVMQFHPRRSEYVNNHSYCLHLWRKVGHEPELPPKACV